MSSNLPVRHRTRPRALDIDGPQERGPRDLFADLGPLARDMTDVTTNAQGQSTFGPTDLAMRARKLGRGQQSGYTKEFILQNLHRMILMRMPQDEIAYRFGVSGMTISNWRGELAKRQAAEAKALNPAGSIGKSLAHFEAAIAFAWQQTSTAGISAKDKKGWVETALRAEVEKQKLLQLAGLYDSRILAGQKSDEEEGTAGASVLANMARMFLEGDFARDERMTVDEAARIGAEAPDVSFLF